MWQERLKHCVMSSRAPSSCECSIYQLKALYTTDKSCVPTTVSAARRLLTLHVAFPEEHFDGLALVGEVRQDVDLL